MTLCNNFKTRYYASRSVEGCADMPLLPHLIQLSTPGSVDRTKMLELRKGSKGESNPGSLDCESCIQPLSYRAT